MNKKIFLVGMILSLFFSISSTHAWRSCDNSGTCTDCNPDVVTHCEPINSDTNTCANPDTPGCTPTSSENPQSNPVSTPNPNPVSHPTSFTNKKDAYLYIKYRDTAGRDIYNIPTYKGKDGEEVDLSKYKKNISFFEFVKYKPENKITLQGGKSLSAYIIYQRKTTPNTNTNSSYHQNLNKIKEDTHKVDTIDTSKSEYHKNLEKTKRDTQSSDNSSMRKKQVETMQKKLDTFFVKKKMTGEMKELLLVKLEVAVLQKIRNETNEKNQNLYGLLLEAIRGSQK